MPTSVRLDDQTEAIVRRLARLREISRSEVIREAIVAYGEAQETAEETTLYERMRPFIGVFQGPGDLSQNTGQRAAGVARRKHADRGRARQHR